MRAFSVVLALLIAICLLMACTPQSVVSTGSGEPPSSEVVVPSSSAASSKEEIKIYYTYHKMLESELTFEVPVANVGDSVSSASKSNTASSEPSVEVRTYTVRLVQTTDVDRKAAPNWIPSSVESDHAFYGDFVLEIWHNGEKLHTLPLNTFFENNVMMFVKPQPEADPESSSSHDSEIGTYTLPALFPADAPDYNGDGLPDYMIGQAAPSGGLRYILLSITPDGEFLQLPIDTDYLYVAEADISLQAGEHCTLEYIYDRENLYAKLLPAGRELTATEDSEILYRYPEYAWSNDRFVRTGRYLSYPAYNNFPYLEPEDQAFSPVLTDRPTGITRVLSEETVIDLQFYSNNDLLALTADGDVFYYGLTLPIDLRTQEMVRLPIPESVILMEDFCFATKNGTIYIYTPSITSSTTARPGTLSFYTVTLPKNETPLKMQLADGDLFVLTAQGNLYTIGELGLYGEGLSHHSAASWNNVTDYRQPVEVLCPERITDFMLYDSHLIVMCGDGSELYHAPLYYHNDAYLDVRSVWQSYNSTIPHNSMVLQPLELLQLPTEESDGWVIDALLNDGYVAARTVEYYGYTLSSGVYALSYPKTYTDFASLYTAPQYNEVLTYDAPPPSEPKPPVTETPDDLLPPAEGMPSPDSSAPSRPTPEPPVQEPYLTVAAFEADRYLTLTDGTALLLQPSNRWKLGKPTYFKWMENPIFEQVAFSNIFACNDDYLPNAEILFCSAQQIVFRTADNNLYFAGSDPLSMWSSDTFSTVSTPLCINWLALARHVSGKQITYGYEYPGIPNFEELEQEKEEGEGTDSAEDGAFDTSSAAVAE